MKKGLILALFSIGLLLLFQHGLDVSYIQKTAMKIVFFLVIPLILLKTKGFTFIELKKTDWKSMRIALGSGLAIMFLVILTFIMLIPYIDIDSLLLNLKNRGGGRFIFPFVAIYILVGNSLLEEFFFRGVLPSLFQGLKMELVLPPLFFALYHMTIFLFWFSLPVLLLVVAGLWIGGVVFQIANRQSGTILPSWTMHMFADIGVLVIGVYLFYFY